MSEEKTESPTEQKLREARTQGAILKSQDIVDGAALFVVVLLLIAAQPWIVESFHDIMQDSLAFVDSPHDDTALLSVLWRMLRHAFTLIFTVLAAAVLASLLALGLQVGVHITFKPVTPKLDMVNPAAGLKRIFSLRSLLDLVKAIVKALVFLWIGAEVLFWLLPISLGSAYQPVRELAQLAWTACLRLLQFWLGVYVIVGIADWFLQRVVFMRSQRMSKDEIKREHKNVEGDPEIKGERRKQQRSLGETATPDPSSGIRQANVLVTNPTHYAVALRYAPDENPLPWIVARGMDEQAARLRQLAHQEGIPLVANPPLARALYKIEPEHPIPDELFEAVAAVLRWVRATAQLEHLDAARPKQEEAC